MSETGTHRAASHEEGDVFRDSLLRYLAFTSDLGESFKHSGLISRRVYLLSYGVAAAYGVADTFDKGLSTYRTRQPSTPSSSILIPTAAAPRAPPGQQPPASPLCGLAEACRDCLPPPPARLHLVGSAQEQRSPAVLVAAAVLDSALWHGAASLAIPGVMINRAVWASGRLLGALPGVHPRMRALGPSAVGLALIPLVVPHIDEAVTAWMDAHVRPYLNGTGS